MTESTLTAIDSLLDAIALEYEQASDEQRETMSPFCKFFYEMAQDNEPVASGGAI
jgi:hypothetical protein